MLLESFFLSWTLILSIKTFIEKPPDFFTKSSAPNFNPSNSSISSSFDVKKITGKDVFFLSFFSNSSPSIFGIFISITARSGGVLVRPINALSPSIYVWTLKPSFSRAILKLVRIFRSSSIKAMVCLCISYLKILNCSKLGNLIKLVKHSPIFSNININS